MEGIIKRCQFYYPWHCGCCISHSQIVEQLTSLKRQQEIMTLLRKLRKFGFDYYDMPTILWNIEVLFRTFTVNINKETSQKFSFITYFITIFSGLSYIYAYVISMIWFVLVRCRETDDFISATIVFSITMCSVTCIPRMFYMKFYRNSITDLVEKCLQCNKLIVRGTRFETNFLARLKDVKRKAIMLWSGLALNGVVYVFVPLLKPGRHFPQDLIVIYGLEPMYESPNYEIAMVMFIASSYGSLFMITYVSLFMIVIVGFVESQMLALTEELENLWDDSEEFYNDYKFDDESAEENVIRNMFIKMRLSDIVKFHTMNINLRYEIKDKLQFIFFNDFIFMAFAIVAELMGGLQNTAVQIPFTFGMVCLDCYIGQRLLNAAATFEEAVYSCQWENFNVSNRKTVFLMLLCSGRAMTLSAGGMSVLDYPFLMAVLKSTYSAYTTLKSTE